MSKGRLIIRGLFSSTCGLICLVSAALNAYLRHQLFWLVVLILFGASNMMVGVAQLMMAAEKNS